MPAISPVARPQAGHSVEEGAGLNGIITGRAAATKHVDAGRLIMAFLILLLLLITFIVCHDCGLLTGMIVIWALLNFRDNYRVCCVRARQRMRVCRPVRDKATDF